MAETIRLHQRTEKSAIARCREVFASGGLVVFPTDTVYGLAAGADMRDAVRRIFDVKGREADKSIVVMVEDAAKALEITAPEDRPALRRLASLWPGPLTLVVRAADVPWREYLAPGRDTLGIRVPSHRFVLDLLAACGPLAVTSANPSGEAPPRCFEEIDPDLLEKVELALDGGECASGLPSTVAELRDGRMVILREGEITHERLESILRGEAGGPPAAPPLK